MPSNGIMRACFTFLDNWSMLYSQLLENDDHCAFEVIRRVRGGGMRKLKRLMWAVDDHSVDSRMEE